MLSQVIKLLLDTHHRVRVGISYPFLTTGHSHIDYFSYALPRGSAAGMAGAYYIVLAHASWFIGVYTISY